jgi:hypothetical protein
MTFTLRTAVVALALLAPAASASAATVETDLPCYVSGQAMAARGLGWGPNSAWAIATDPAGLESSGVADAAGNWQNLELTAPTLANDKTTKPSTYTLSALQDGQPVASSTFQVVNFYVKPKGKSKGKPTKKIGISFSGFQPGQPIYVHVKRSGSRKVYTQKVGTSATPCGTLSTRIRRLPAVPKKKIKTGSYTIAFDNRKAYTQERGQFYFTTVIYTKYL